MMATEENDTFLSMLEKQRQAADGGLLAPLRDKAWSRFHTLGLPDRHFETYKYLKLRNLYNNRYCPAEKRVLTREQIEPYLLPESRGSLFVFVNGHYSPALSERQALPGAVAALPLEEAMRSYRSLLTTQWGRMEKEERDPFAAANGALHREGLFLYFPPGTSIEQPIQLLNIIDSGDSPMLLLPRVELFAGKECRLDLISMIGHLSGNSYGYNQLFDAVIEENSVVCYHQLSLDQAANKVWHFDAVRARLKRASRFKAVNINNGCSTMRSDYNIQLTGEGGEAELDGLLMLAGSNESHTNVLIDHHAPHCRSRQLFKNVLKGSSKGSFEGKILVRREAQKTDAFQLNNNLLLDTHCHADSKPNLEIFADDVKASHGATFGRLNEEQLFYLKTRGFSHADASSLLIYAFCKEVVERVAIPSIAGRLKQWVEGYVH